MTIADTYPDRPVIRAYMSKKCRRVLGAVGARYKVLYGGRGGSKSWAVADYLLARACQEKLRILCTREIQTSIKDSVHRLLQDRIIALGLSAYFTITQESIRSITGSEFIFKGLRTNINEIKSTEGIDICWVEEAAKVSEDSWKVLIPTIRKENSEIIVTFNPDEETDPVYQRFVLAEFRPPSTAIEKVSYADNAYFPEVLEKERLWCQKTDPEAYENIWLGNIKHYSDALIFKNKYEVRDFDIPEGVIFYYGGDFGFAEDALWFGRCFIKDRCLWVPDEVYGVGIEIGELHYAVESVPGSRLYQIRADSARPDTINYLAQPAVGKDGQQRQGFNIIGAEKGKGSVEDGIEFLRSFEKIIIHPRCKGAISNFENYRWKQDKITGNILPVPVDKHNHACFSGDTMILMADGNTERRIDEVKVGDMVMTSSGPQKVLASCMTDEAAKAKEFVFSNGRSIVATPNHPVYTKSGKLSIDELRYCDIVYSWTKSLSMARSIDGTVSISSRLVDARKGEKGCTSPYGNTTTDQSRKGIISTILTTIQKTILSEILNVFRKTNIFLTTPKYFKSPHLIAPNKRKTLIGSDLWLLRGIKATLGLFGTVSTVKRLLKTGEPKPTSVNCAENLSQAKSYQTFVSVPGSVKRSGEEITKKTTSLSNVLSAQENSRQISIQKLSPVHLVAERALSQKIKVYNLTVDKAHNYFANGILVSNCDGLRYALEPYIKKQVSIFDIEGL